MATNVGEIQVVATLDTAKFKSGLGDMESAAKTTTGKIGDALKGVGSSLASAAKDIVVKGSKIALAGGAAIGAGAVKGFSDWQQMVGGIDKLFGDASKSVQANAAKAYKTAGMSANDYMETTTSFAASLIKGLNGDTAKAANIADTAIRDMSDNANTFGTSIDSIQYAYQGFAKQNYTMLDNLKLGYGGTAGEMARLVNESGVMGKNFTATAKNINDVSFDKIIEAIHVTQERLKITGTTAKEAGGTVEGSFNQMKGAAQNFLAALGGGGDTGQAFNELVSSAKQFGENLVPVVEEIIQNIGGILPNVVEFAQDILKAITDQMPVIVDGIITVAVGLVQSLGQIITAIVNYFTIPENVQKMVDAFVTLLTSIAQAIPQLVVALAQAVPTIVATLTKPENIMAILNAGVMLFTGLVRAIPKILPPLAMAFGALINNLWGMVRGLFVKIGTSAGDAIGGALRSAVNAALGFIEGALNKPIALINGVLGALNNLPGVNIGKIGRLHLPRLATGGYVGGAGSATSDSNLAWLSRGEYVVKADTVRRYGVEFMDALNSGRLVGGGGSVQNYYYQFDRNANSRWQYQQIRTGAAA